jgi:hypothetical protein
MSKQCFKLDRYLKISLKRTNVYFDGVCTFMGQMSDVFKVVTNGRTLKTVGHIFLRQALMLDRFISFSFRKGD